LIIATTGFLRILVFVFWLSGDLGVCYAQLIFAPQTEILAEHIANARVKRTPLL
jgi:methylase of polypeptide subunit release factors